MSAPKLYADRDPIALGSHYTRHIEAMTVEDLHDKGDIAAELAWRDAEIERLRGIVRDKRDSSFAKYQEASSPSECEYWFTVTDQMRRLLKEMGGAE